jgi:hypothetical protein
MIESPSESDNRAELFEDVSATSLRTAAEHDEWLLDEALAETFPASDSIAISSQRARRISSNGNAEGGETQSKGPSG